MKRLLSLSLILSVFAIGGCASGSADSDVSSQGQESGAESSVLSKLRPKANPNMVRAVQEEENRRREEQMAQAQAAMAAQSEGEKGFFQSTLDGVGSILPTVSTEPIAASKAESLAEASSLPVLNPFESPQATTSTMDTQTAVDTGTLTPADDVMPVADSSSQQVATYSLHYNPAGISTPAPGAIAGGNMVPPPPQISLSTDANMYPPPPPNAMPYNPYQQQPYYYPPQSPYQNPAMNPWGVMPPQSQQPVKDPEPKRPAGLFGVNKGNHDKDSDSAPSSKRQEEDHSDFVPIRPTGMQARSPYKQRDDLKILWDGALTSDAFHAVLAEDDKLESILRRVPVGMPPDSTKGMFSVPQRRVDTIFRPVRLDKKVAPRVSKLQKDLVNSYYRYMHTYDKYALAQQTMQARKQQIEVARSRSEKQRAAADLASAESQAEAAKEDMKAAQYELAAVAGARSARSVIGRISGVTPTVGALAEAEKSTQPIDIEPEDKGVLGSVGKLFFGNRGSKKKDPPKAEKKVAKNDSGSNFLFARKSKDLKAKPEKTKVASKAALPAAQVKSKPASPISFELKNVNITARKSILSVAIRNTGNKEFKVAPNDVSISEGTRKISNETLRAKFDSNIVKPNQEVKGKITIYGRPWNDRLAVYISDGSSKIQLNRRN